MNDNILRVSFGGVRTIVANPLWQYDYGQTLLIKGLNLPDLYEVHFAPSKTGNAVTVIGTDEGVSIPDALLETAGEFFAWIYLHTGEADGETEYQIKIPVKERAKPTHEEPTPVQKSEIEQIIAALGNEADRAEGYATSASQSASDAADSASSASQSATSASQSASAASQSASSASSSASSASASASSASASEENAAESAEDAERYADLAEQIAATNGYMFFYIDEHGDLIYQRTSNTEVDFYLLDGDLYVKAVG